jgi:hypothetical protein
VRAGELTFSLHSPALCSDERQRLNNRREAMTKRNQWGRVWEFKTARFVVALEIQRDRGYQYDGDDEDGETQAKLDSGEYVAFDSCVVVEFDGEEIARDSLCGSVYASGETSEFWTAHRTSAPEGRNYQPGQNYVVCHYFPDMVRTACEAAREYIREGRVYIRD